MKLFNTKTFRKLLSFMRKKYLLITAFNSLAVLIISWDPNAESDLMGYKVYYGLSSRKYDTVIDVGNITSYEMNNLAEGIRYYFAATAYDSAGNESAFSEEVSAIIPEKNQDPNNQDHDDQDPDIDDNSDNQTNEETLSRIYNFPNPFKIEKEVTRIRYFLEKPDIISIKIYDINNVLVKTLLENASKFAGEHLEDFWDGKNNNDKYVSNGVFLCKIMTKEHIRLFKIAVLR